MSARLLAVAAIVVALAAGCGSGSSVTLQQVQASFARNGLHVDCTAQRVQTKSSCWGPLSLFFGQKDAAAYTHATSVAYATGPNPGPDIIRRVMVFDNTASAKSEAAYVRRVASSDVAVIVIRNALYTGPRSTAARDAMNSLRKK